VKININLIYLGGKMYSQILVSYDISETKKRNKFFDELKDLGLKSIQKSVFWGYVLPSEKRIIMELFKKYCDILNTQTHLFSNFLLLYVCSFLHK